MDLKKRLDEGNYGEYFDISPMACAVTKALKDETGSIYDYMVIYVNPAMMNQVGLMEGDTIGMYLRQNVRRSGEAWLSYYEKAMVDHQLSYYLFKDMEGRYVLVQFGYMEDDRMTVVFQQMDEIGGLERLASKSPQHSEHYDEEATINLIPEGIAVFRVDEGFDTVLTFYNDSITEMTGFTRQEIDHGTVKRICYPVPDDVEKYMAASRETIRSGKPTSIEYRSIRKDGSQIFIETRFATKQSESGELLLYAIYNDITPLKEFEVKLEESQMAYRVAIENDRICLWHYDILTQTYFQDQTTAEELEELISVQPDYPETKILMGDVRKDSEEKLRALFDKICAGEEMVQDEIWIRSAVDPEEFICTKVYIRNLRDEFGEIIRTVGITRNITEEIQNRIQKQKYELAIADSSLSIWEFDLNNDTYSISEETAGRFGIPAKGEGMPEVLLDNGLILKDSEETYLDMYRQLKDGITQIRAEMHLRNKDGGDNWQECTYYTVCDDRGEPSYAIGCSLDYTAIRIKERHYQEELEIQKADLNEQMISKARADVTTGIIETMSYEERHDTAGEVPTLEELSRIMQKFAEDDAMKKHLATVFSKEYLLSSYADGKKELSFEGKAAVSEGMPKWVKVLVRLHTNPENGHIMAFIYAYDVNREHSVADIFNHVVDQDYEFVGVVDGVTGRYKTFEKQGYNGPRPGTEGDTFVEDMLKLEKYLLPEEQERFRTVMDYSHILGVLDQGRQAAAVFGCMYDNKEVHYLRFRASYTDPATRRFIITATDVSDIIEGENTNHTALAHALKNANDAVQIKSAVLSKVTHDVRTPLASITGLLSLMKEAASKVVMTKEERAKFDQYFRQLDASSTELLNSINDVQTLDTLDKESRLHISDYSFTALLTELSNKAAKEASLKGVHYKADFGNLTDRMMKIDVSKVRNMMSVLFYNAVRYTPAGKQVQMMANEAPYGDNKIIYTISIKDNGVGISKDLMPHIFDLFSKERTGYRDGYNGTGLELPVAKQLADVMQADLSADSLLGKGSTFTVTLPLEIAEDAGGGTGTSADSNKKKDPSDVIFAERRVLIAEDNEMNAEVTRMILENKGVSVMVAANGEETLRLYQDNEPGYFDAILMDLRMPVMDGFEATRQIRSAGRADSSFIPIIAMSADMYEEDIKACEEAGMNRNLNKPIQPDLLFDTLAELMY